MKHNRLRRTLLWVTSNNEKNIRDAIASNADVLCFDLEDGIPNAQKADARAMAAKALGEFDLRGKERVVRINPLDSFESQLDLEKLLPTLPDAIRLPKCESVEYVLTLDRILSDFEKKNNLEENTIEIILMIETAKGLIHCYDMALCCSRVSAMGIGMEDMTASLGVPRIYELNSNDLIYPRQKLVVSARAANVQALDSCVLFLGDLDYVEKETIISKRNGFEGRSVFDIAHIEICNRIFTPSHKEVEWATKVLESYKEGISRGVAEIRYQGIYIDPPVIAKAERIINLMELIKNRN